MDKQKIKSVRQKRRQIGIRKRVSGTVERPRLNVFRSAKHIYVQLINDVDGKTICHASSVSLKLGNGGNVDAAKTVGAKIAESAKAAGVAKVVFDRGGFKYHGRVEALADAAREAGLDF